MPSVFITGANRGIGLEFARQYSDDGWDVIATARQSSPELDALGVRIETLDLADANAVTDLAAKVDRPLGLLIANAGTNHPMNAEDAEDARDWQVMMMVNSIAPFMLGKMLLPRVAEAKGKMVAISSGMGSTSGNNGGWIPYRTSKAALNMAWSCLAIEARPHGVPVVALSPGWVKTRMGGGGAEITPEESVGAMRRLIDGITMDQTGHFLRRDGHQIPW